MDRLRQVVRHLAGRTKDSDSLVGGFHFKVSDKSTEDCVALILPFVYNADPNPRSGAQINAEMMLHLEIVEGHLKRGLGNYLYDLLVASKVMSVTEENIDNWDSVVVRWREKGALNEAKKVMEVLEENDGL